VFGYGPRRMRRLQRTGVAGTARLLNDFRVVGQRGWATMEPELGGVRGDVTWVVKSSIRVTPPAGRSYDVKTLTLYMPTRLMGQPTQGLRFPVKIHPKKPRRVVYDTDPARNADIFGEQA
jgi:hypothetical protein